MKYILFVSYLLSLGLSQAQDTCSGEYLFEQSKVIDDSGNEVPILILEFEDLATDATGDWEVRDNNLNQQSNDAFPTSFSGSGFLYYNGKEFFQDGGNSNIDYRFKINDPGVYRFVYASAIGIFAEENPGTEHNDSWVKFPDASAFYGYNSSKNTIVVPNGQDVDSNNLDPNDPILQETYPDAVYKLPQGSNPKNNGYFKVYINQLDDWWYEGSTSDSDAHNILVRFDEPGTYTMQISGRSKGFSIDRAVLWQEVGDFSNLNSKSKRKDAFVGLESASLNCESSSNTDDEDPLAVNNSTFVTYPNPTSGIFVIRGLNPEVDKVIITDAGGQAVNFKITGRSEEKVIDLGDLPEGTYHLKYLTKEGQESIKIIKKD